MPTTNGMNILGSTGTLGGETYNGGDVGGIGGLTAEIGIVEDYLQLQSGGTATATVPSAGTIRLFSENDNSVTTFDSMSRKRKLLFEDDTDFIANKNHRVDPSIHFTEASIDHGAIMNSGVNTHDVIDTHITTAEAHIADDTKHRLIDDAGAVAMDTLWSSEKISTQLNTKVDIIGAVSSVAGRLMTLY